MYAIYDSAALMYRQFWGTPGQVNHHPKLSLIFEQKYMISFERVLSRKIPIKTFEHILNSVRNPVITYQSKLSQTLENPLHTRFSFHQLFFYLVIARQSNSIEQ